MGYQKFISLGHLCVQLFRFTPLLLSTFRNTLCGYFFHWLGTHPQLYETQKNLPLSYNINSNEILVSFDAISLFTRIPVGLALDVARERLEEDESLSSRTSLSVDDIISLLALCLKATFFTFREVIYQQIYGTAMGSPVSVVVANLVMELLCRKESIKYLP